jgi:hypothetical protein
MSKRVNIALKLDTHTQAKLICVLKNTTLNEYFKEAIEKAVEKDKDLVDALFKKKKKK